MLHLCLYKDQSILEIRLISLSLTLSLSLIWEIGTNILEEYDVFLTVHHSTDFFKLHNSFILQQYVCYITILNMFRAARCLSQGRQIVLQ